MKARTIACVPLRGAASPRLDGGSDIGRENGQDRLGHYQVQGIEFSLGVSVGGIQVGNEPKLAVSPFVGLVWRREQEFRFEVHNMFSAIPGAPVGIYDRTAVTLGYASKTGNVSLGPSLSIYWIPVCNILICNRVMGVAPGGHAQTDWYFAERLGASVSANLDWASGVVVSFLVVWW